jgi:dTDP-4-dehydrorhamnose 3,5-epimerase
MQFERSHLEGLVVVHLDVHGDERGFFVERFKRSDFEGAGVPVDFVQDNHSRSAPGVLRGIHYQHSPAQGKLVGVTRGVIWDAAVDLRPDSQTFGQSYGVQLSDMNGCLLWIPPGFGHGFCVLGDESADVLYKTTAEYEPTTEGGILWDDPELAVEWPLAGPALSDRDKKLQTFAEYRSNPPAWRW